MKNYITNLYAKNTGVFEELDVSFNRSFNFIVGPNGCGKTSILKCIALALAPQQSKNMRYKENSEVWFDTVKDDKKYRIGLGQGWVSNAELYRESGHKLWVSPPTIDGTISLTVNDIIHQNINITPLILGAYRRIEYKKIEGMQRESNIADQRKRYHSSGFTNIEGGVLPNVKQWMINRYFQIEKEWALLYKKNWEWIINNLNKVSPLNSNLTFKEIKRDLEPVFILNGKECYLEEVSAGFQSFLSMIFAIVEWIEGTNEEDAAYIPDAAGTVIIDELDVHLHPEWQLSIREALLTLFPKLQFIITTHSPHLIATAHSEELIILPELNQNLKISPTPKTYSGWNTDQILEEVMGVKSLENKTYALLLKEAMNCVENKNIRALENSIHNLENVVHPSNTIVKVLRMKLAELILEDKND